jgi:hypothetical protein
VTAPALAGVQALACLPLETSDHGGIGGEQFVAALESDKDDGSLRGHALDHPCGQGTTGGAGLQLVGIDGEARPQQAVIQGEQHAAAIRAEGGGETGFLQPRAAEPPANGRTIWIDPAASGT